MQIYRFFTHYTFSQLQLSRLDILQYSICQITNARLIAKYTFVNSILQKEYEWCSRKTNDTFATWIIIIIIFPMLPFFPDAISDTPRFRRTRSAGWNFRRDNRVTMPDFIRFSLSRYILQKESQALYEPPHEDYGDRSGKQTSAYWQAVIDFLPNRTNHRSSA